jgi:hypothetical protein
MIAVLRRREPETSAGDLHLFVTDAMEIQPGCLLGHILTGPDDGRVTFCLVAGGLVDQAEYGPALRHSEAAIHAGRARYRWHTVAQHQSHEQAG